MEVEVYDPAMCCSTGVCGSSVDPALAQFASDVEWLAGRGVSVKRFNLSQEPGAFASSPRVSALLQVAGGAVLPVVMVGSEVKATGHYPSRSELEGWALQPSDPATGDARETAPCCGGAGPNSGCC
ncbi:MAG: arsenite efflux transporter metallochaperone ArsD [Candidatus Dormibacteria bacterium]